MSVCVSICTICCWRALSLCTNAHASAVPNTCLNHSPIGILSVFECLKVHVLQSVESSMESYEQPGSLLTKSGRRRQISEETLCRRRERDRERKASESGEERELHCNL